MNLNILMESIMVFTSIASGSDGNCTFIGTQKTKLLVDCGISCKRICQGITKLGADAHALDGILITHEHSDHVKGLYVISKKYHIPIYGTFGTLESIKKMDAKNEISDELFHPIEKDTCFTIGEFSCYAFSNTHDAVDPVGYRIEYGDRAVAVATDLGNYTPYTVRSLLGLDGIILEANHDISMLMVGSYPYSLKRRIISDYGHLSNERCGQLLCEIMNRRLKHVFLGHLSEENNLPEVAISTVMNELREGISKEFYENLHMVVAKRDELSEIVEL